MVRQFYPRFLKLRTLMVGCSAGEAHLAATATLPVNIVAETLSSGIVKQARSLNAQLIVLKEFPARYRRCTALLLAMRLRSCAEHADDDARHRI